MLDRVIRSGGYQRLMRETVPLKEAPKVPIMPGWYNDAMGISDAELLAALFEESRDFYEDLPYELSYAEAIQISDNNQLDRMEAYAHLHVGGGRLGNRQRRYPYFSRERK